jgi:DsbC/DsbD-like thiol-disulfide interchange protein
MVAGGQFQMRYAPQDRIEPSMWPLSPIIPATGCCIAMKVDYAVCEKLCLPVEAKAELPLPAGNATTDAALAAAEASVPKQVSAAEAGLSAHRPENS